MGALGDLVSRFRMGIAGAISGFQGLYMYQLSPLSPQAGVVPFKLLNRVQFLRLTVLRAIQDFLYQKYEVCWKRAVLKDREIKSRAETLSPKPDAYSQLPEGSNNNLLLPRNLYYNEVLLPQYQAPKLCSSRTKAQTFTLDYRDPQKMPKSV